MNLKSGFLIVTAMTFVVYTIGAIYDPGAKEVASIFISAFFMGAFIYAAIALVIDEIGGNE